MKYYLKADWQKSYQEVSKKEYIKAEQGAGFYSNFGEKEIATAGFSSNSIQGKVEYEKGD